MRRRTLLAGLGCIAATAGCLGSENPTDADGTDPSTDGNATITADGDGSTDGNATTTDDGDSATESDGESDPVPDEFGASLEYPGYVLSMRQQFAETGPDDVPTLADRNAETRAAVEAAIGGGFETDDASDALLEGLHRLWYVEHEGTVYELSWTMPEYVLRTTTVEESAADADRTAGMMDDRIRVLGPDNRETVAAVTAVVGRDGPTGDDYRTTVLADDLADFLETYDYVAYPDDGDGGPDPKGYVELSLEREDPGPPYAIEAEPISDAERYDAPVTDVEAFDDEVADALRRAAREREARLETVPDGLADATGEGYVRVDGDVYAPSLTAVENDGVPLALSLSTRPDDRALELTVENEYDGPLELFGGAPAPFGVLRASAPGDGAATLWSDAYEESGHVHVDEAERRIEVNDIGLTTELEAGETVSETYEAREAWGFDAAGEYRVESGLSASPPRHDVSYSLPFTLVVRVPGEEAETE